ncbi:MAG TPA: transposase [Rhizomicrobium sp.]|jgi:putative transposase|nr:transposase [Rhizomicrobium sp.]
MARLARVVAAGAPHLVTQRGNRGQNVFFSDADYELYKTLLAEGCRIAHTSVLAWCLLPDRVHLILVPRDEDGLRAALGEAHRRYTREINNREGWRGFLWQGRFASYPMDAAHLPACARYVELSPVLAKLVKRPRDWRWSSARAHLLGRDDELARVQSLRDRVGDWREFLAQGISDDERKAIQSHESTGRPLGSPAFVSRLEKRLGRTLARQKPGPKPRRERKKFRQYFPPPAKPGRKD